MPAASKATLSTRPTRTRASRWALTSVAAPGGGVGVIGSLLVVVVVGLPPAVAGGGLSGLDGSERPPLSCQARAVEAALPALVVIRLTLGLGTPAPPQLGAVKSGMGMPKAVVGKGPPQGRGAHLEGTGRGQDALLAGQPKRLLNELPVGHELLRPTLGLREPSKRLPVPGAVQDAGVDAQLLGRPDGAQLAGKREGGDGELRITGQVAYTGLVLYPAELPQGTPGQIGGDVGAQCPSKPQRTEDVTLPGTLEGAAGHAKGLGRRLHPNPCSEVEGDPRERRIRAQPPRPVAGREVLPGLLGPPVGPFSRRQATIDSDGIILGRPGQCGAQAGGTDRAARADSPRRLPRAFCVGLWVVVKQAGIGITTGGLVAPLGLEGEDSERLSAHGRRRCRRPMPASAGRSAAGDPDPSWHLRRALARRRPPDRRLWLPQRPSRSPAQSRASHSPARGRRAWPPTANGSWFGPPRSWPAAP